MFSAPKISVKTVVSLLLQLPSEMQAKVRTYVAQKRCSTQDTTQPDVKSITVPISTFPPTAMVYNISKPTVEKHSDDDSDDSKPSMDIVSAAIMAKVLEDREKERIFAKHCDTCTCHRSILTVDTETQTYVPDTFPISEGYIHSVEKQASEGTSNDEKYQSKDKFQSNLATHTIFYEINENGNKIRHHMNGDYVKYAVSQTPCIKDKFVGRSRNGQDYMMEENSITMTRSSLNKKNSQSHENKRSCSRLNDLNRINVDKTSKPLRANKCDSPVDSRSAKYWNKGENFFEHFDTGCLVRSDNRLSDKEQMHIDIINDRLWKNEWTKLKSETDPSRESKCKINRDIELDIINDRDWKNDKSAERQDARNTAQFTVIEVKSPDNNVTNHNDISQTEVTTSPSFSSDSMVISSSDPSSSCSDVAQSLTGGAFNSSAKSNSNQNRVTGPRNCLVRVTSGSKNILLDNAGHYKTVLYSSTGGGGDSDGGGKISTALVHAKKTSRAGSERSTSTGSEDNSPPPVLLQDNQLQRVAEWVQSSMCAENSVAHNSNKIKCIENAASDTLSSVYLNDSLTKRNSSEQNGDLARNVRDAPKKSSKNVENHNEKNINNEPVDIDILSEHKEQDESENLITFEDEHLLDSCKDLDYEVKVTKEMEETYLKLAASLDPVTLSLSNTNNAELTIEKYRKDHKRLHTQRIQDKAESKA